jgi:hypothetical protein
MKYLKYFESNSPILSDYQIQQEFRKDIPEKMYDIWDICLDFSDDFTQNLRFFVVYGNGRFIIPIYMSDDFNLDISNSFENLDYENKRKLISVILADVSNRITWDMNLRYPVEFLIKWENPFEKCDEKMTELSEIIRLRGIDIKLNKPKNKYGRNDLFIEVEGKT